VLDPIDGNFHYANAGHPAPRLWRAGHRVVEPVRDATGLPLGMERHAAYHHRRTEIGPGDVLLLYTDGLTAALDERGEMFGCARLDAALAETAGEGAEAVKDAVVSRLDAFLGGAELQDDVALVVVSRDR
ncbi:MAG TPA: PP2C family protein-serine/threonine phosphatase, partial [Gemmataceae bacterium]|nr:PP2C family protein-serine/threonine phosphatase [Gemmataceae bacterium]